MEPRLPTPAISPEINTGTQKEPSKSIENRQEAYNYSQDQHVEERAPASAELSPQALSGQASLAAQQASSIAQTAPTTGVSSLAILQDDLPIDAKDEDLIEREWVVKAKAIVQNTRADPYQQEEAISKLQREYLKKRYGKDLKASSES
jgi:hypothetical protein